MPSVAKRIRQARADRARQFAQRAALQRAGQRHRNHFERQHQPKTRNSVSASPVASHALPIFHPIAAACAAVCRSPEVAQ